MSWRVAPEFQHEAFQHRVVGIAMDIDAVAAQHVQVVLAVLAEFLRSPDPPAAGATHRAPRRANCAATPGATSCAIGM
jgi:hypothetical protein